MNVLKKCNDIAYKDLEFYRSVVNDAKKERKMKVLVEFYWDCGRSGEVNGLFICFKEDLEHTYGKGIYFGEILGKHSEVYGTLGKEDITIKSEDQDFIEKLESVIGSVNISGYNPLQYIRDEEEY